MVDIIKDNFNFKKDKENVHLDEETEDDIDKDNFNLVTVDVFEDNVVVVDIVSITINQNVENSYKVYVIDDDNFKKVVDKNEEVMVKIFMVDSMKVVNIMVIKVIKVGGNSYMEMIEVFDVNLEDNLIGISIIKHKDNEVNEDDIIKVNVDIVEMNNVIIVVYQVMEKEVINLKVNYIVDIEKVSTVILKMDNIVMDMNNDEVENLFMVIF